MRRQLKLAFGELEIELPLISQINLTQVLGGNSSGSNSSGSSLDASLDVDGNSGYNMDGMSGFNGNILEMYIGYFQSYGYSFSGDGAGNYTYYLSNNANNGPGDDPWQRDVNGKLIATLTEKTANLPYGDVTLIFDEVKIRLANGSEVVAYKTSMVYDWSTQQHRLSTDAEKSNCTGLAFADGEYWFWENTDTSGVDEVSGFLGMLDSYYEECSKSEATVALMFDNNTTRTNPIHAGIVNGDGSCTAKGGTGEVATYTSESAFKLPLDGGGFQYEGTPVYYKPRN